MRCLYLESLARKIKNPENTVLVTPEGKDCPTHLGSDVKDLLPHLIDTVPFVFSKECLLNTQLSSSLELFYLKLDFPFPKLGFEFLDGSDFFSHTLSGGDVLHMMWVGVADSTPINPDIYAGFVKGREGYLLTLQKFSPPPTADPSDREFEFYTKMKSLLSLCIDEVNKPLNKTGEEKTRIELKFNPGDGSEKVRHIIRKVIHIAPKDSTPPKELAGRTIDWTHRFAVRGHWRVTPHIGKNSAGEYTEVGRTWVKHHIRGPEHLPLVNKTRLVTGKVETREV